jgi:hypothetical protein
MIEPKKWKHSQTTLKVCESEKWKLLSLQVAQIGISKNLGFQEWGFEKLKHV